MFFYFAQSRYFKYIFMFFIMILQFNLYIEYNFVCHLLWHFLSLCSLIMKYLLFILQPLLSYAWYNFAILILFYFWWDCLIRCLHYMQAFESCMPNLSKFFLKFENHCMFWSCSQTSLVLLCELNAQQKLYVKKKKFQSKFGLCWSVTTVR